MDVILDSNIFLADVKFQGTQFAELFAYLRRSGNKMILPTLVAEEVSERYRERLQNAVKKARSNWSKANELIITSQIDLPVIDFDEEVQHLSRKLTNPVPGVEVLQYSDVSAIDVNEVARRGIKRLRPANTNGEELRDVIIWLLVLQYAKTTQREVALISGDHGFRESDVKDTLHPDLQAEVSDEKLPIHFHSEISSFVTSQSLSQDNVDQSWVSRYIAEAKLLEEITGKLLTTYVPPFGVPQNVIIKELKFVNGIRYQISKDSVYGELKYQVHTSATFPFFAFHAANFGPYKVTTAQMPAADEWRSPFSGVAKTLAVDPNSMYFSPNVSALAANYSPNVAAGIVYSTNASVGITRSPPQEEERELQFDVSVSLRVVGEKLQIWQIDELRLR